MSNNRVIACVIGEDITDTFEPNLALYPTLKPIFALIETYLLHFLQIKALKKVNWLIPGLQW